MNCYWSQERNDPFYKINSVPNLASKFGGPSRKVGTEDVSYGGSAHDMYSFHSIARIIKLKQHLSLWKVRLISHPIVHDSLPRNPSPDPTTPRLKGSRGTQYILLSGHDLNIPLGITALHWFKAGYWSSIRQEPLKCWLRLMEPVVLWYYQEQLHIV